jgi:hypothetical protein
MTLFTFDATLTAVNLPPQITGGYCWLTKLFRRTEKGGNECDGMSGDTGFIAVIVIV